MFDLRVLAQPAAEVVTPAELAAYLRLILDPGDFGDLPQGEQDNCALFAKAGREYAEGWTRRTCITTTYRQTQLVDRYGQRIRLLRPPIAAVSEVKVAGVVADAETYALDAVGDWVEIVPEALAWLPGERLQATYTAGYGATAESVPASFKLGILKLGATMYEHRTDLVVGTVQAKLESDARALLTPLRVANV